MKYKVVGVRKREGDFVTKDTKQNIHFTSYDVYYQDLEAKDFVGLVVEKATFQGKAFESMMARFKITSPEQLMKYEFDDVAKNDQKKPILLI